MNSDGVCLRRSYGAFKATSSNLCCFSIHWVIDSGPSSSALFDGFLFISVLLNAATSLEKIHRFRSVLVFSY